MNFTTDTQQKMKSSHQIPPVPVIFAFVIRRQQEMGPGETPSVEEIRSFIREWPPEARGEAGSEAEVQNPPAESTASKTSLTEQTSAENENVLTGEPFESMPKERVKELEALFWETQRGGMSRNDAIELIVTEMNKALADVQMRMNSE